MDKFEHSERRSELLIKLMDAIEANNTSLENVIRLKIFELDSKFKEYKALKQTLVPV